MDQSPPGAPTRPNARRRRLRRVIAALVLGDLGTLVAAPAFAATPAPFSLQVSANQAIFQVTALKPGPVGQRCLVLQAVNGTANLALLSAQIGGSGLTSYLDLTIEQGPANGAASCATMPANLLFAGPLDQLAASHPDAARGLAIPFDPATSDTAVRVTVSLRDDNRAQGLDATATFNFQADDTSVATAPPSATTLPAGTIPAGTLPATVPATVAPAAGATTPTRVPATTAVGRTTSTATATSTTSTTRSPGAATTAPGRATTTTAVAVVPAATPKPPASIKVSDPSAPGGSSGVTWSSIPEAVKTTVALTAKASSVPALFLGLVFVFLILQDRIDRNDPKLARAPLRPDPEILFLPRNQVTS